MNEILIYFSKKLIDKIKIEDLSRELKVNEDVITNECKNSKYLFINKNNEVQLKPEYRVGSIDLKKTFGFLRQKNDDIHLEEYELGDAMNDDIVILQTQRKGFLVIDVIQRALKNIIVTVGRNKKGNHTFKSEKPLDRSMNIKIVNNKITDGMVLLLSVDKVTKNEIIAHDERIIGHKNDPDIETMKIVYGYNWSTEFSNEIYEEINDIKINYELEEKRRLCIYDKLIVTIDGKDAKDLDDAISLEKLDDNLFELGVHIADVSYFVKENSKLDEEAITRGTSVYLADRVIPMLPHALSNGDCSLNPNEKKLSLSCFMKIDKTGKVISYEIKETIIVSKYRLTYDQVNLLFKKNKSTNDKKLDEMLLTMNELSRALKKRRHERGALEFISTELGFNVDENGKVLSIYERVTDEAEELIESFMLLANETVAFHMHNSDYPSIYRIHETPDSEKINNAFTTIMQLGIKINAKTAHNAKGLQTVIEVANDTKFSHLANMVLLRSMQKAKYTSYLDIHYGLGAKFYTHFTSPIRRYPDLLLHRLIRNFVIDQKDFKKKNSHFMSIISDLAEHSSAQERKAIQMERDVEKLKCCEYLLDKIGLIFDAQIIQMMPIGMFVKLTNGIEGLVALKDLKGYYEFDKKTLTYYTSRGKSYHLGELVKVQLIDVNMMDKQINFSIADNKIKKGDSFENSNSKQKSKA